MAQSSYRRPRPARRRRSMLQPIARLSAALTTIATARDRRSALQAALNCLVLLSDVRACAAVIRETERDAQLIAVTPRDGQAARLLSVLQAQARSVATRPVVQTIDGSDGELTSLLIPVLLHGRPIGMLGATRSNRHGWQHDTILLGQQVADHLGAALERLTLQDQLRNRSDELAAVVETAVTISSQHELAATLQTIVEHATRLARAEGGSLYLCDESAGELEVVVSYLLDHDYRGERVAIGDGVAGRAAQTGHTVHVVDYPAWEGRAAQFRDSPFYAILAVPLVQDGRALGVIDLVRTTARRPFSANEIDVVTMLANLAVVAIANVRLYDATQQYAARMSALAQASQALDSHGNLDATIRPLAEAGMQALGAQGCLIVATDPPHIVSSIGLDDRCAAALAHELTLGSIPAWPRPEPIQAEVAREAGFGSQLTLPFGSDLSTGAIMFVFNESLVWQRDDAEVARVLANQITALITNARLYQAVRASDRLKTEFISTVSHELRTPMGAIIGYTELLLNGLYGRLDTTIHEPISRIKANADRLLQLINQMLDLSRIEAGRLQIHHAPFQPRDLLQAIADHIAAETRAKNLMLHVEVAADVPAIAIGDVGRIRQVLMCLCSNALKFTHAGGIELRCRREAAPTPQLVFDVSDTGIGIEPAHLPLIWEAFRQVDGSTARPFDGAGLGLALVQRLTHLMGGSVSVVSTPGHGSTFTIRLPLALP